MEAERCVRRLHIRTADRSALNRAAFLLEDALHTASLPGLPRGGVVYVRRLDLGAMPVTIGSRALSRRIDAAIRGLAPFVVPHTAADAPHAAAVWFDDELEPYHRLADMMSRGRRPGEWYWPAAVKGWSPRMSPSQGFRCIVAGVLALSTGMEGLARVLAPLLAHDRLLELLAAAHPRQVAQWLAMAGLEPPAPPGLFPVAPRPRGGGRTAVGRPHCGSIPGTGWRPVMVKTLGLWPAEDPRVAFCGYLTLAAGRRRLCPSHVARLIADIRQAATAKAPSASTGDGTAGGHSGIRARPRPAEAACDARRPSPDRPGPNAPPVSRPARSPSSPGGAQAPESRPNGGSIRRRPAIPPAGVGARCGTDDARSKGAETGTAAGVYRSGRHGPTPGRGFLAGPFTGQPSAFAGLPLIVTLLQRLGFDRLVERYPVYHDIRLGERILQRAAALMRIPPNDPVRAFLDSTPPGVPPPLDFAAPRQWRSLLAGGPGGELHLSIAPVAGAPEQQLVMDAAARLVVSWRHRGSEAAVRPWLDSAAGLRHLPRPRTWGAAGAVDNFIKAVSRYLRLFTHLDLASLVRRPALIATTRTHLDLTVSLDRLDMRLRMAALDADPGWVPWLGRVIRIHYVEDPQ